MKKIAVVGSLNVDYVVNVCKAPQTGDPVLANSFSIVPGGKGANQAFALGRMGAPVAMFGAVGNDKNASIELENLLRVSVNVEEVLHIDGSTGMAMITVDANGDNRIIVVQGANQAVSPEYIDSKLEALKKHDIIIFQLEIPMDTVTYAAKKLKSFGKTIILDPAPVPDHLPEDLLKHVDYIKPNETELARLTHQKSKEFDIGSACDELLIQGVGCVLASMGGDGVVIKCVRETEKRYSAEKVNVIDTTAAGDAFTASVAYALANDRNIEEAVQFANKVAAVVVQRPGAQNSIPEQNEILEIWNI